MLKGNGFNVASGIAIYGTATNSLIGRIWLPDTFGPGIFSQDSTTAYIAGPRVIAVYNATTFQQTATFNYTTTFSSLAVSPDGALLYATDQKAIYVLDAATGAQKQIFLLPAPAYGVMALSLDGSALFLTDSQTNSVDLINTATGQVTAVPVPYPPSHLVVLP